MKDVTLCEILRWTNGECSYKDKDAMVGDISKDTRTIKNGDTYIALVGEKFDGHNFINDAFKAGAAFVIAGKIDNVLDEYKDRVIKVLDTYEALSDISSNYVKKLGIPVLAITGSVGKTTTKEMIVNVLKTEKKVLKTEANLNNTIGAPFTALELDPSYDIAVIEAGMNHKGELEAISRAICPSYAAIINIGDSHIGNLGSRENIFKAKCEIFSSMKEDGVLFLNKDDDFLPSLKDSEYKTMYAGFSDIDNYHINDDGMSTTYNLKNGDSFVINSVITNHANAAMFGYMIGKFFGISEDNIKKGIATFKNLEKRLEMKKVGDIVMLKDCYNSCFNSILSAVQTMENLKNDNNHLIAILGDVKELGDFSEQIHGEIGMMLNKYKIDKCIFIGDDIINAYDKYEGEKEYYKTKEEYMDRIDKDTFSASDVVLVKASNSCKFNVICDYLEDMYK